MVTLATAVLPSDSEPDDEDYADSGSEGPPQKRRRKKGRRLGPDDDDASELESDAADAPLREARARKLFEELQAEETAASAAALRRRPPQRASEKLFRDLHRRHERPPKDRSRKTVFAELAKYSQVRDSVAVDATATAGREKDSVGRATAELKKRVRRSAALVRGPASSDVASSGATSSVTPSVVPVSDEVVVEDVVRFAGETVTVRRVLRRGSAEALRFQRASERRRQEGLGGSLQALDAFLQSCKQPRAIGVLDKSDLDWQNHRRDAGLEDLKRDQNAGALERHEFLERATARSEAAMRASQRAAERAAARRKAQTESANARSL
eukprot:TRINITY_DN5079_c0_g4_i1.p1 TRINITY_DN5079_c0_g4~~TRINITY_DN5079_c0_g4_i1.p1  ORF type:complete len:326 (-),score=70.68 TRINITY_DN5079_c0_g4_i1:70-1047(-)